MKKIRLFDFSVPAALSACIVFPFLAVLCFNLYYYEHRVLFGVLLPLVILSFCLLIYFFVFRAPVLDESGLRYKKLFIPRERIELVSEYDIRFKESVYYLRDKTLDYSAMEYKEQKEKEVRVQATMANTRKLTEYMHTTVTPASRPKKRWSR